jgi:hypothetical protein
MLETTGLIYYQACPVCREPYGKIMKAACYDVMCSECAGECPWTSNAWCGFNGSRFPEICLKFADTGVCNRRSVRMQN